MMYSVVPASYQTIGAYTHRYIPLHIRRIFQIAAAPAGSQTAFKTLSTTVDAAVIGYRVEAAPLIFVGALTILKR